MERHLGSNYGERFVGWTPCTTSDMKQKVAAAMADKYWIDILVWHESHPMVARLVPEAPPSETSSH
jgi:hypothetical protein